MTAPIDVDAEIHNMFFGAAPGETPEKVLEEQSAALAKKIDELAEILRKNKDAFAGKIDEILKEFEAGCLSDDDWIKESERCLAVMDKTVVEKKDAAFALSTSLSGRLTLLEQRKTQKSDLCTALSSMKQNLSAIPRYSGAERFLSAITIDSKKR